MPSEADIEKKFWKALKSDRTVMLGLQNGVGGDSQPMTAQLEGDEGGPVWFFTSKDTDLARAIGAGQPGVAQLVDKGHDLFATFHGRLTTSTEPAVIERLWNPFVAAWFENGKDDPTLLLLRFEVDRAHIWLNESSVFAGVKLLLGKDPKKEYGDKVAEVRLR